MTRGHACVISLMDRYRLGSLDPFVTLLEIHKLLYFMQDAGEDLRLDFKKANFGPYAQNLRHVLHRMEGHHIMGTKMAATCLEELELVPGAVEDAEKFLAKHSKTTAARVSELVDGSRLLSVSNCYRRALGSR